MLVARRLSSSQIEKEGKKIKWGGGRITRRKMKTRRRRTTGTRKWWKTERWVFFGDGTRDGHRHAQHDWLGSSWRTIAIRCVQRTTADNHVQQRFLYDVALLSWFAFARHHIIIIINRPFFRKAPRSGQKRNVCCLSSGFDSLPSAHSRGKMKRTGRASRHISKRIQQHQQPNNNNNKPKTRSRKGKKKSWIKEENQKKNKSKTTNDNNNNYHYNNNNNNRCRDYPVGQFARHDVFCPLISNRAAIAWMAAIYPYRTWAALAAGAGSDGSGWAIFSFRRVRISNGIYGRPWKMRNMTQQVPITRLTGTGSSAS